MLSIHGGPEWHERDRFDPRSRRSSTRATRSRLVNYRGSTGYGIAFREALIGNACCLTESEDILACLDALDRRRHRRTPAASTGAAGPGAAASRASTPALHPDRWRAIFAGIPAGDFVAAHWASAPELQAWDDAVYGGSPDEVPDSYRQSDPMTYVEQVTAPVLVIAGENDPRCPIEGVTPWVDAVRAHGGDGRGAHLRRRPPRERDGATR